jgi:repressor LexA
MNLTKRQKEILDYITQFIDSEGYSPSMEEIAARFEFASLNAVYKHLEALSARGFLRRDPNRARSIELSSARAPAKSVPLFGYVAAGRPIEAVANAETVNVPDEFLTGKGPHYVLRVQGESMIEEHIADGDYVIVESRNDVGNGEMVVALVDNENVTLKRLYRESGHVRLQPANAAMPAILLDPDRVSVQGVVVGVMRRYS